MPLHVCSALCLRVMLRLLLHRWELGAHHPFKVLLDAETDEHAGAIGFGPTPRQQAQLGRQAGRKATRVRVPALDGPGSGTATALTRRALLLLLLFLLMLVALCHACCKLQVKRNAGNKHDTVHISDAPAHRVGHTCCSS